MPIEEKNYYLPSEIKPLLDAAGRAKSTFYNLVHQGKIASPDLESGKVYDKASVDAFLGGSLWGNGRKKHSPVQQSNFEGKDGVEATVPSEVEPRELANTDWIQERDLPYVFGLDYEVYGLDATVSPLVTRFWWEKNPYACRILFNRDNRKDVWGALTILPMQEDVIFSILKGDLEEKDIVSDQILRYEPGGVYDGYVASFAIRPERRGYLRHLLQSILDHWCGQYPQVQMRRLYAFALGGEGSDGMRVIRKMFFSPLYERRGIEFDNAWELRLDRYNPSKLIQHFQTCIKQKQSNVRKEESGQSMVITIPSKTTTNAKLKLKPGRIERMASRSVATGRYREVQSEADLRAIVEIGDLIFGASNVSDEALLKLFSSWWRKNPEIFHVLDIEGTIEAFTSLLPLTSEKIDEIICEKIRMSDIHADDILPFEPGKPVKLFVHVVGVPPRLTGTMKRNFGGQLVAGIAQTFVELGQRGIDIISVEARSNTYDGINLSTQLGFAEIPPPLGVKKKVFKLDVRTSELLIEYRRLLAEYKESPSTDEGNEVAL